MNINLGIESQTKTPLVLVLLLQKIMKDKEIQSFCPRRFRGGKGRGTNRKMRSDCDRIARGRKTSCDQTPKKEGPDLKVSSRD